jgi:hypothetical protein
VHGVGVGRHGRGLVALQGPDEVPRQVEVGALGRLLHRLLVAVLPHVPHAEVGEEPHVGGWEELGDDHEGRLVGVAARAGAGVADPLADSGQPSLDLFASVGHPCLRITPASRPAPAPSRR